jgi:hypothetical protein
MRELTRGDAVFFSFSSFFLFFTLAFAEFSQGSMLFSSNFCFAKENELTIIVRVLRFVQCPSRYEISNSIDLVNLMAFAGGANADGAGTM